MKKNTNFNKILFFLISISIIFSCKKVINESNEKYKIIATNVENSSPKIKSIKASVLVGGNKQIIGEALYKDNGFILEIPKNLSSKYLNKFDNLPGINNNNKEALMYLFDNINGYDSNGNFVGYFFIKKGASENPYYIAWIYVDREVNVKGETIKNENNTTKDILRFDLELEKGWNIIYKNYVKTYDAEINKNINIDEFSNNNASYDDSQWVFHGFL